MYKKIETSAEYIRSKTGEIDVAIILGTGLAGVAEEIVKECVIPYTEIPNFAISTVEGHHGNLIYGTLGKKKVLALQGRFHYYEGFSMQEVTFPVRVFNALGIKKLIVSNASGGLNPNFKVGDIMVLSDHINFFPDHPLRGTNLDKLGPRFPDMSEPYSKDMIAKAFNIAHENGIHLQKGVYVGVSGPTFETPAEYLMFRRLGADAVGMSTVPEVIVARHMGMLVFGISVITDSGVPGEIKEVSHAEVQMVASKAEPKLTKIIKELVQIA